LLFFPYKPEEDLKKSRLKKYPRSQEKKFKKKNPRKISSYLITFQVAS